MNNYNDIYSYFNVISLLQIGDEDISCIDIPFNIDEDNSHWNKRTLQIVSALREAELLETKTIINDVKSLIKLHNQFIVFIDNFEEILPKERFDKTPYPDFEDWIEKYFKLVTNGARGSSQYVSTSTSDYISLVNYIAFKEILLKDFIIGLKNLTNVVKSTIKKEVLEDPLWFKFGLHLAKGDLKEFYRLNKNQDFIIEHNFTGIKIAEELGNTSLEKYIMGTFKNYGGSNQDKNLFATVKKPLIIINYCHKYNISIDKDFTTKFNSIHRD